MPRRYHVYPEEFQVLNVLSSAGASILAVGYLIPLIYLIWSMRYGPRAEANPWGAKGLEWETTSPPPKENFEQTPVVTEEAYNYARKVKAMSAGSTALSHQFEDAEQQREAVTLGLWTFLLTEVMLFGGLFAGYTAYPRRLSGGVCPRQPPARP